MIVGRTFFVIQVIKRDGTKSDFILGKINDAIMKAFVATQMEYNNDIVDLLALRVTADFQAKVKEGAIHVEAVQDSVGVHLMTNEARQFYDLEKLWHAGERLK